MNINYDTISYPALDRVVADWKATLNFFNLDFMWILQHDRECWDTFLRHLLDMDGLTTRKIRRHSFQMGERKADAISMLAEHSRRGRKFIVTYVVLEPGDEDHLAELPAVRDWDCVQGEEVNFAQDKLAEDRVIAAEPLIVCIMREDIFIIRKFKFLSGLPFVNNDIYGWSIRSDDSKAPPCPTMFLCARYNDGSEQAEFVRFLSNPYSQEFFRCYGVLPIRAGVLIERGIEHLRKKRIDGDIAFFTNFLRALIDRGKALENALQIALVPEALRELVVQNIAKDRNTEEKS